MKKLNELFNVHYGNKLDLNKMDSQTIANDGVNFVGRSSQNHGVSGTVARLTDVEPYPAGLITVALGGTKILSSFVQEQPFYTAQNVAILTPKSPMTFAEKLYMCLCIRQNRFRYSAFGREANRTLRSLLVPEASEFPLWVRQSDLQQFNQTDLPANPNDKPMPLKIEQWKLFRYDEVFVIKKGCYNKRPPLSSSVSDIPFIGATEKSNGVTGYAKLEVIERYSRDGTIKKEPLERKLFDGKCITVSNNGSVGEAFYQDRQFTCSHDVNPLYLKDKAVELNREIGLFISTVIRLDKYRWGFGRKWRPIRMPSSTIKLPVKADGTPDFDFMERYIKSLPYSSQIQ